MKNEVPIETETIIRMKNKDVEMVKSVYYGLKDFISENRDFYITVFKNKDNRKIILKLNGGLLKKAQIEKLDIKEL